MKQCSICGYLFEPDESKPLRCPRCGIPFQEESPSEHISESSPSHQPEQPPREPAGSGTVLAEEPPQAEEQPTLSPEKDDPEEPQSVENAAVSEPSPLEENPSETKTQDPPADQGEMSPHVPAEQPDTSLKPKWRWLKVLAFILLLLLVAAVSFFLGAGQRDWLSQEEPASSAAQVQPSTGQYYDPQGISSEEFSRLQLGMTYAQISAIIGGDAYQTTVPDVSGSYSAAWQGQDNPEAVLTVRFVNGQAMDFQQSGLADDPVQEDGTSPEE